MHNIVLYWGKLVGGLGTVWVQQFTTQSFALFARILSQTLSPAFYTFSYQLRVAFYSSSTLSNNNKFSNIFI
jgi:hypothetical protein